MDARSAVGKRLAMIREHRRMSQTDLAAAIGVTRPATPSTSVGGSRSKRRGSTSLQERCIAGPATCSILDGPLPT